MTPEQWKERSYERNVADARKKRKRVEARNKKAIEKRIQFERDYEEFSELHSERLVNKIDNTVTLPLKFDIKRSTLTDNDLDGESELIATWFRRRGWFVQRQKCSSKYIVRIFASRSGMIWNKIKEDLFGEIPFYFIVFFTLCLAGVPLLFWIITLIELAFVECSGRAAIEIEKA